MPLDTALVWLGFEFVIFANYSELFVHINVYVCVNVYDYLCRTLYRGKKLLGGVLEIEVFI